MMASEVIVDGERDEAVESAAAGEAMHWREAVRALAQEPLPQRLRLALAELGAQGHRLGGAVEAYNARLERLWDDPAEILQPARMCREWPEFGEREEARRAYESAKDVLCSLARSWVEGRARGGGA
jgi:hypothetical protein